MPPRRKTQKPETERRRRARVRVAVDQLRVLLVEGGRQPPCPAPCTPPHLHHLTHTHRGPGVAWRRLEKVVVLELTVAHLRHLASQAPASRSLGGCEQYRTGYLKCLEEVMKFLGRTAASQTPLSARLWRHLHLPSPHTSVRSPQSVPRDTEVLVSESGNASVIEPTKTSRFSCGDVLKVCPGAANGAALRPSLYTRVHWKKSLQAPPGNLWRPW